MINHQGTFFIQGVPFSFFLPPLKGEMMKENNDVSKRILAVLRETDDQLTVNDLSEKLSESKTRIQWNLNGLMEKKKVVRRWGAPGMGGGYLYRAKNRVTKTDKIIDAFEGPSAEKFDQLIKKIRSQKEEAKHQGVTIHILGQNVDVKVAKDVYESLKDLFD